MESFKTIHFILPVLFIVFSQLLNLLWATDPERPLKTGDMFTPVELLPVAVKLMEKVDRPGWGKGIVSVSHNPADLADRLFEAFFMTTKRFVTITEFDIKGLDALQALALSGDAANNNGDMESVTDDPVTEKVEMMLRGQIVKVNNEGPRCKYKLLRKKVDKFNAKRRGLELIKKLSKKRRLIVKSRRTNQEKPVESHCRWRYECSNPGDLDSCQLHTECAENDTMTTKSYIGAKRDVDPQQMEVLNAFRKMLGMSIVDEEVEKILETRYIYMKPNSLDPNDRIESLSEYFNNIIMAQVKLESTPAVTNDYMSAQPEGSNEPTESAINSENLQNNNITSSNKNNTDGEAKIKRQF